MTDRCDLAYEEFWKNPAASGRGEVWRLRDDICLGLAEQNASGTGFTLRAREPVLMLELFLPPAGKNTLPGGLPPNGILRIVPPGSRRVESPACAHVLICISTERLKLILGADMGSLPARAADLLRGGAGEAFAVLAPEHLLAGRALLDCPYEGAVRNIILKSRVLELVALFFGQLAGGDTARANAESLSEAECAQVSSAREALLEDMLSPPGISQLARRAGLSETRLKRLFKVAYGMPPYVYLRRERMSRARALILERGMNVAEAAAAVGYQNTSHFIEAFTRQYGVRPGALRKRLI